jgi:hypothetical protein
MMTLKERLRPPSGVVLAAPAVFGLDAVIDALAGKRSAAEAALAEAEAAYRKAALDEQRNVPGAAARKSEAAGALRSAQEHVNDILGAQVEADAERRENALRERVAKEEAEDAEVLAAGMEYCSAVAAWSELATSFARAWERIFDAEERFHKQLGSNRRTPGTYIAINQDIGHLLLLEIARVARVRDNLGTPHLPGSMPAPQSARSLRPLNENVKSIQKCLEKELAAAAAARAKRGRK